MKDLILIKIGGGSITDQNVPRTAKREEISRLLSEIYEAKKAKDFDIIIGHGSGSFGHVTAKEYKVNEGIINEKSLKGGVLTMIVASELSFIVIDEAVKLEMPIFPFFPSSFSSARGKKINKGFVENIRLSMEKGFIPMVHGDVVIDEKQGIAIASTEEVFRFISKKLNPAKIILATDVDGIYDKDPSVNNDAKLITIVNNTNIKEVISGSGKAKKVDVTGGMRTKVSTLYKIVERYNSVGYIVNATKPGIIKKILIGDESATHTKIVP